MALVIYYVLFGITVLFALGVLFNRNTVRSAICLVGVMAALAVNYLIMRQEFVAFIQIVVYTGAIMVLFLFVIMLLNLREPEVMPWYLRKARFWGGALSLVFFFTLALAVQVWTVSGVTPGAIENEAFIKESGTPEVILLSTLMITKYVAPFILTSILLLVAVIGAIVMAKRYDEDGQEIISEEEVS
ncbi:MAG: NADH-quinone oxidoreductase subunit J [Candidatus Sumerlaeia bacterium]|nr:NADH-quinone oxidoreductase subunit J [Candidatus Sumerlaeia bacterium]